MKLTNYLFVLGISLVTIVTSCKKDNPAPEPAPTADFTYSGAGAPAPAKVTFTNTSTNAKTYSWDFGDNSTSTETNPSHTYLTSGVFTVKLTATGAGGSISTTKTVNVANAPTKVKITKVTITSMPFVDGAGASWDSSGPDLFITISDQNNKILFDGKSLRISDVTPSMLPISFELSTPFEIADFSSVRYIDLWDYDFPDADDYIGSVGFQMSTYTTGNNPYLQTVTRISSQSQISITLSLIWQ